MQWGPFIIVVSSAHTTLGRQEAAHGGLLGRQRRVGVEIQGYSNLSRHLAQHTLKYYPSSFRLCSPYFIRVRLRHPPSISQLSQIDPEKIFQPGLPTLDLRQPSPHWSSHPRARMESGTVPSALHWTKHCYTQYFKSSSNAEFQEEDGK